MKKKKAKLGRPKTPLEKLWCVFYWVDGHYHAFESEESCRMFMRKKNLGNIDSFGKRLKYFKVIEVPRTSKELKD